MQSAFGTENNSDLDNGEWAVTFSYGTVKGVALCSSTSGSYHEIGSPNENAEGENCWCKAISYASENQNFCNVSSSPWVLGLGYSNADSCKHDCAYNCAGNIQSGSQSTTNYRRVLYGITQ